jgi:hypothetical protein
LVFVKSPLRSWLYSLTQEWPIGGQAHQLSYTLPYQWITDGDARGIGDVMINYRYQLCAEGNWAWVAPRFSVILPTGNESSGLGGGSVGLQVTIPVSKELSDAVVAHGNAGCTVMFSNGTPTSYYAGGSLVWHALNTLDFMLEGLSSWNAIVDANGGVGRETEVRLSPGVRFALNLPHLQVVPGIGLPILFKKSQTSMGLFLYLSFEHPF